MPRNTALSEITLARLIEQALGEGCAMVTLRAVIEEASELGAARALARLGLTAEDADGDLADLLSAWREMHRAKTWVRVRWVIDLLLTALLVAAALHLKLLTGT